MASDSGIPGHLPHQLAAWWEHGEGAARIGWGTPGSFMRCVRLAETEAHMTPERAKGFCAERYHAATGKWPGEHHHAGRSTVTEPAPDYDADGLDGSWDGDHSDLPDLTGLGVEHFEAAAREAGEPAPPETAQRAMPKLGTGARFAKLKSSLAAKGAHNPGALAAYIGRRKFGKAKFAKLAAKARGKGGSARMSEESWAPLPFSRDFPLQDISIRAGGDGRTVDAYAAVFDTPTPIHDQQGDYIEVIDRHAFNRILPKLQPQGDRKAWRCGVFYNHGMTLHGTPSGENSLPIGVPLEIRVDGHGLFTRTRYHKGPEIDRILEAIREGSLQSYSFSGRFDQSEPRVPRGGFKPDRYGVLPTVTRRESTLREYGPTPFPAYHEAAITAVRAEQLLRQLEQMAELLRSGAPLDSPQFPSAPPDEDSPTDDLLTSEGKETPEGQEHSVRYHQHALYAIRSKELREKYGLVF